MSSRRLLFLVSLVAALVVALMPASGAQEPVTVPTAPGETVTVSWEGTVLPGANTSSECGPLDVVPTPTRSSFWCLKAPTTR